MVPGSIVIQQFSSLVVRVGVGDKFGKGSSHVDIMRSEETAIAEAPPKFAKFPLHVPVAMGTIVKKHVNLGGQLVATNKLFDLAAQRDELRPEIVGNQRPVLAMFISLDAIQTRRRERFVC